MAALLAAPLLLVFSGSLTANPPTQCYYGHGCGGFCMNLFGKMHQHGPLFNYGPYYGYPPFEPYGPWNAYLQYNPWYYGNGYGGGGHAGLFHGHLHGHGCWSCGLHANWLHGGWFHGHGCLSCGTHSLFHHGHFAGGCSSCGHTGLLHGHKSHCDGCKADATPTTTDPVARFTGAGTPQESASFYAALPTLMSDEVTPAAGSR